MSDITKCPGTNCSLKETCYRFTALSHEYWHRRADFAAYNIDCDKGICTDYWIVVEMKQAK